MASLNIWCEESDNTYLVDNELFYMYINIYMYMSIYIHIYTCMCNMNHTVTDCATRTLDENTKNTSPYITI